MRLRRPRVVVAAAVLIGLAGACDSSPTEVGPTASAESELCDMIDPDIVAQILGDDDYKARTDGQLVPDSETSGVHCSVRSQSGSQSSIRVSVFKTSAGVDADLARLEKNMVDEGECSLTDADSVGRIECHHDDPSSDVSAPGVKLVAERGDWLVQASVFRWSESSTQQRTDAAEGLVEYAGNQLAEALAES